MPKAPKPPLRLVEPDRDADAFGEDVAAFRRHLGRTDTPYLLVAGGRILSANSRAASLQEAAEALGEPLAQRIAPVVPGGEPVPVGTSEGRPVLAHATPWNGDGGTDEGAADILLVELTQPPPDAALPVGPSEAERDPLTDLLEPMCFALQTEQAVARAVRRDEAVALFVLEYPDFPRIRRKEGHDTRRHFLRDAAKRLRRHGGGEAVAARLEGARYAVLMPAPRGGAALDVEAERMGESLRVEADIGGGPALLRPRIGMALMPDDTQAAFGALGTEAAGEGDDAAAQIAPTLRDCARLALDDAMTGPDRAVRFRPAMAAARRRERVLKQDIGTAIESGGIKVVFQPVMDIATMKLVGFEALMRWRHPEFGPVAPPEAVALAERQGQLDALTRHVVREALREGANWPAQTRFAVNVTPSQLDRRLVALVAEALEENSGPPGRLEIEVTEDAVIKDWQRSAAVIEALRGLGVRVAMDDFGAGFTSLRNLKRLAFDKIKIDRSLCEGLGEDERTGNIVAGLVHLAQRLGIEVTVEGIETAEQLAPLAGLSCFVQGYVFSPPVPCDGLQAFRRFLPRDEAAAKSNAIKPNATRPASGLADAG